MRYGIPEFPVEYISKKKFCKDVKRTFSNTSSAQIDYLFNLAVTVTKQAKGALLIISNVAENEAKRLGNQCFPLQPEKLSPELC
ncbi:MAG: hypothetical protein V4594_12110 [Bacteroidota bacterium]